MKFKRLNQGMEVDVVHDDTGKDASLDSLHPRGMMISCGSSSGPCPTVFLP